MLRDPFGDIDWDLVLQMLTTLGFLAVLITMAGASSGDWQEPWRMLWATVIKYQTLVIASLMVMIMSLWWYEQFNSGYRQEGSEKMSYEELQNNRDKGISYLIMSGLDLSVVQKKVNSKIKEGFVTKGELVFGNGRWAQVMIRND